MSSKTATVTRRSANEAKKLANWRNTMLKFSLTVIGFMVLLVLSVMNDYLFIGWLGTSMAIVLALFCIHIIGEQQTKRA